MDQYKIQQIINAINCGLLTEQELLKIYQIAIESHRLTNVISQSTNYLPSIIHYKEENDSTGDVYLNPNEKTTGNVPQNPNDKYRSTPVRIDNRYYLNSINTIKAARVVPDSVFGFRYDEIY